MHSHLDESSLAVRWGISRRTLQRWRQKGAGPAYLRLGGRITYAAQDIVEYELASRVSPSEPEPHEERDA
ncbi:helix-turn-helix domain-containing protein [Mesorhizobium sp. M1312]|uniref:helix-turn-helix transcriptional regulator n=1 Tax=unclassified Mesorhizobium TaxID=325217 RepID=UPI00333ACD70